MSISPFAARLVHALENVLHDLDIYITDELLKLPYEMPPEAAKTYYGMVGTHIVDFILMLSRPKKALDDSEKYLINHGSKIGFAWKSGLGRVLSIKETSERSLESDDLLHRAYQVAVKVIDMQLKAEVDMIADEKNALALPAQQKIYQELQDLHRLLRIKSAVESSIHANNLWDYTRFEVVFIAENPKANIDIANMSPAGKNDCLLIPNDYEDNIEEENNLEYDDDESIFSLEIPMEKFDCVLKDNHLMNDHITDPEVLASEIVETLAERIAADMIRDVSRAEPRVSQAIRPSRRLTQPRKKALS